MPTIVNQFFVDNYCRAKNEPFFTSYYNGQIFNEIAGGFCNVLHESLG